MRILLISNSTQFGSGYLDHCAAEISSFLGKTGRVLFIPYALYDCAAYTEKASERLARLGYQVDSALKGASAEESVGRAEAIFIGGGNTFRLLTRLYEFHLVEAIRSRVRAGVPYIGASAGSIVAGPTIKTTKDMPILQPASFDSLNLVPFQISPHYLDPDPSSTHMGETQEERILQFLEENDAPVVGLREGGMVRVEDGKAQLKGVAGARVFRRELPAVEMRPGEGLNDLLSHRGGA